jgi:chaperone required for assembly of F1-ATPase
MTLPAHPKRFYKTATTLETDGGFAISLDGRIPKTPAKASLILPNLAIASLVAAEWDVQGESVIPASMPLTRLVNVVIDRAVETRAAMIDEVVKYAATDLVCYRAPTPKTLVAAQAAAWNPLMDWASTTHSVALDITYDAMAIPQPTASLNALRVAIERYDNWHLTALAFANGLAGSAIVALALVDGLIDGETAFKAIRVEENWQAARWGADPDEEHVANARRLDLVAVGNLVGALADRHYANDAMN